MQKDFKPNGSIWISGTLHNIYSIGMALEQEGYKIIINITWQKTNPPPSLSCRCFTEPGAVVLDPFCCSGTTGVATIRYGRKFIGIDNEKDYLMITKNRLETETDVGKEF